MATAGPNSPSSAANSGTGTAWTSPTNALTSNDTRATALLNLGLSQHLRVTGFGFSLPATATVTGITVSVEKSASGLGVINTNNIQLVKTGATVGSSKSSGAVWPGADAAESFGSSSDLWGWTPAYSDINDATFGVQIKAFEALGEDTTARIDHITITVTYTTPSVGMIMIGRTRTGLVHGGIVA